MFTISQVGERGAVIDEVKALKPAPTEKEPGQLERAKVFIVSEIEALPAEFNSCRVEASGDAQAGGRVFSAQVVPMKFVLRASTK